MKRGVHRVMRKIQKERLVGVDGFRDSRVRFDRRASVRNVSVPWYCSKCGTALDAQLCPQPVVLQAVVTAGRPKGPSADVDVESQIQGIGPRRRAIAEMPLANVNCPVAGRLQEPHRVTSPESSPDQSQSGGPRGPRLLLSGLIQFVTR